MRRSFDDPYAWQLPERRKEARFKLILRAGVLEQAGRASICLVKNISATGVQLKVYTKPLLDTDASVRVADEDPVSGRVAWIDGNQVGVSLDRELDTATLLRVQQKLRTKKRRSFPRMEVQVPAQLRTHGRIFQARVHDISSLGARVGVEIQLQSGDQIVLEIAGLPLLGAYVRWADGRQTGLAFQTPIPINLVAHWLEHVRGQCCQPPR